MNKEDSQSKFQLKFISSGDKNGSVRKGTYHQAWWSDLDP